MTLEETLKLLTTIQATFPTHKENWEDEKQIRLKAKMWQIHFSEFSFEEVFSALCVYASDQKFPPAISDLKHIVAKNRNPEAFRSPEDAWEDVLSAVKKFGYYQQEKAFEGFDPQTKRLVRTIGWGKICQCTDEKIGFLKNDFSKMWENVKAEEKEANLVPIEVINRMKKFELERRFGLPNAENEANEAVRRQLEE